MVCAHTQKKNKWFMDLLSYKSPESEVSGIVQFDLLCQSSFNGEREFDPLQDAFGDWDPDN